MFLPLHAQLGNLIARRQGINPVKMTGASNGRLLFPGSNTFLELGWLFEWPREDDKLIPCANWLDLSIAGLELVCTYCELEII